MKLNTLLFTLTVGFGYVVLSASSFGPAAFLQRNCTGAKGSVNSCGTVSTGCHGGTSAATSVTIEVDSAGGIPVTKYRPGVTYTIKIVGHNTSNLPGFGFQYVAVSGIGTAQVQAGTNSAPTNCHISTSIPGLDIVEHGQALTGTGGTYTVPPFTWTAPAAGKGTVTMYCTLNAVDLDQRAGAPDVSNTDSIKVTEGYVGVAELAADMDINIYPNPASNCFNIHIGNANGAYEMTIMDISGRKVHSSIINVSGSATQANIDCITWPKGYYAIQISHDGAQRVLPFVKI